MLSSVGRRLDTNFGLLKQEMDRKETNMNQSVGERFFGKLRSSLESNLFSISGDDQWWHPDDPLIHKQTNNMVQTVVNHFSESGYHQKGWRRRKERHKIIIMILESSWVLLTARRRNRMNSTGSIWIWCCWWWSLNPIISNIIRIMTAQDPVWHIVFPPPPSLAVSIVPRIHSISTRRAQLQDMLHQ